MDRNARKLVDTYRQADPEQRDQLQRLVTRMLNGSKRVERLGRMLVRGQITPEQFLALGGK